MQVLNRNNIPYNTIFNENKCTYVQSRKEFHNIPKNIRAGEGRIPNRQ